MWPGEEYYLLLFLSQPVKQTFQGYCLISISFLQNLLNLFFVLLLEWLGRWYISLLNIELLLSHTALVVASMYVEDDQALNYEVFKLLCQVHWRVSG